MSYINALIAGFLIATWVPSAFAKQRPRVVPSIASATAANCIFPDGSIAYSSPELHCYSPAQLMNAYGIDVLHDQGITGKNQTIVITVPYGNPTIQSDLDHFSDIFGLPRTTIRFIYPNGPYTNPVQTTDQLASAIETALDTEWAHVVAPDATIVLSVSSSDEVEGITGLPDIFLGLEMATALYPNSVVSMSLAANEQDFTESDLNTYIFGKFSEVLEKAVKANITVLAGSGDTGTSNYNFDFTSLMGNQSVNYPASDPRVTAVGGTWIQSGWIWTPQGTFDDSLNCAQNPCPDYLNSQSAPGQITESVWKNDFGLGGASGGGVSMLFSLPDYQSRNIGAAALSLTNGRRGVPDIAMNAAVNGGVMVYSGSITSESPGGWVDIGGTSAATPEMAGVITLANQLASDLLGKRIAVGLLNPILYELPAKDFNDILPETFGIHEQVTLGDNAPSYNETVLKKYGPLYSTPVPVPGAPVQWGYDLATGRGSPRVPYFVSDLAQSIVIRELEKTH